MGDYGLGDIGLPVTLFSFAVVVFVLITVVIHADGATIN